MGVADGRTLTARRYRGQLGHRFRRNPPQSQRPGPDEVTRQPSSGVPASAGPVDACRPVFAPEIAELVRSDVAASVFEELPQAENGSVRAHLPGFVAETCIDRSKAGAHRANRCDFATRLLSACAGEVPVLAKLKRSMPDPLALPPCSHAVRRAPTKLSALGESPIVVFAAMCESEWSSS